MAITANMVITANMIIRTIIIMRIIMVRTVIWFIQIISIVRKLLPYYDRDLQIKAKVVDPETGKKVQKLDAREQALASMAAAPIDLNKLSQTHIDKYTLTWLKLDIVNVTNESLVIKPFRDDPP